MLLKLGKGTSACVLAIVEEWQHRSTEEMFLSVGARIGYFQGDVKKLVDDIATLRPHPLHRYTSLSLSAKLSKRSVFGEIHVLHCAVAGGKTVHEVNLQT